MADQGLLLVNLGSPVAPTRAAVAKYLNEFLTDKYVIDLPAPLRHLLVRGVITPLRAAKSAALYAKIWNAGGEGSPLVRHTREFSRELAGRLPGWSVRWAMRYGEPSIASQLKGWDVRDLHLVPMYPQYAESSSRTAIEATVAALRRQGFRGRLRVLRDFFCEPEFIATEARLIQEAAGEFQPDFILLSFHGLPEHHVSKLHPGHCLRSESCCAAGVGPANRWCYRAQCFATARAIQARLRPPDEAFALSFQSRLGRRPWIKPYSDVVLPGLAARGVRRILVAAPSFVADCLETLEEIQMRMREQFLSCGGEDLRLVPAPNSDADWARDFAGMISRDSLEWHDEIC